MTTITSKNCSASSSYIDNVRHQLSIWGFSRVFSDTDWQIIHEVNNDRESIAVAAAAIAEARINRFNARGKK